MEQINNFLKKLFYGTVALGSVSIRWVLFFMAFIMFYDVVMRYVFNSPTVWAQETCEYMMVFLTFIGLAETQKQKAHIRMDYLYTRFPESLRRWLDVFSHFLVALFALLIFSTSFRMTLLALQYGSKSNSLMETPLFLMYAIIPVGMILLLMQCVINIAKSIKSLLGVDSGKACKF
ncbi:MAG: TRAP transporter small permease [Deltaproteobacteria bacterium]|nr:TRAP transporter small permease [Deltaproteobacteria bacterium]